MQRWEYRMFNADEGAVLETLARKGVEGWEAFHLQDYATGISGCTTRIYCKRAINQDVTNAPFRT